MSKFKLLLTLMILPISVATYAEEHIVKFNNLTIPNSLNIEYQLCTKKTHDSILCDDAFTIQLDSSVNNIKEIKFHDDPRGVITFLNVIRVDEITPSGTKIISTIYEDMDCATDSGMMVFNDSFGNNRVSCVVWMEVFSLLNNHF